MRNKGLDLLKGFGILLMIFDHVGWGSIVHTYIQSFHMPLFFIVSGYLWKNGYSVGELAKKRAKTVLVPYVSFAIFYLILLAAAVKMGASEQSVWLSLRAVMLYPTDMANMPFAPALWFLPCFWLCSIAYAVLDKLCGKKKWIPILLLTAAGMTYSTLNSTMLPFCTEPLAVALFFMLIGETVKSYEDIVFMWLEKWWVIIVLLLVEAALAFANGSCDMRSARYNNGLLYLFNAIICTLGYWGIIRKLLSLLPSGNLQWVVYFSVNSIAFLCLNQFFIMLSKRTLAMLTLNGVAWHIASNMVVFTVSVVACVGMCELLRKSRLHFALGR